MHFLGLKLTYSDQTDKYPKMDQNIEMWLHIDHSDTLCIFDTALH